MTQGFKFVSGNADSGRIVLQRADNSTGTVPDIVIARAVTVTDNNDSTIQITFPE